MNKIGSKEERLHEIFLELVSEHSGTSDINVYLSEVSLPFIKKVLDLFAVALNVDVVDRNTLEKLEQTFMEDPVFLNGVFLQVCMVYVNMLETVQASQEEQDEQEHL